jgi:hypothetical protein
MLKTMRNINPYINILRSRLPRQKQKKGAVDHK